MRKFFPLLVIATVLLSIYLMTRTNSECQSLNPKYCLQDDDCICETNPCFLGNKRYYNECFLPQQKGMIQACPDACGFGPYEIEVKTICENHECRLAQFNRTTGERIKYR